MYFTNNKGITLFLCVNGEGHENCLLDEICGAVVNSLLFLINNQKTIVWVHQQSNKIISSSKVKGK